MLTFFSCFSCFFRMFHPFFYDSHCFNHVLRSRWSLTNACPPPSKVRCTLRTGEVLRRRNRVLAGGVLIKPWWSQVGKWWQMYVNVLLVDGGFTYFFKCSSRKLGKMNPFWQHIFQVATSVNNLLFFNVQGTLLIFGQGPTYEIPERHTQWPHEFTLFWYEKKCCWAIQSL